MSTSDQNNAEDFAAGLSERLPATENSIGQAGSLPDVAVLARMANEFFRGQPEPAFPAGVAPSMPDTSYAGSAFETRLPQLGMPLPSVPAIPSAGKFPTAPDMAGTELSSLPPARVTAVARAVPRRPCSRDCRNMTVSNAPQRFRRLPSRFRCPSLTMPCFRPLQTGVPALPPLAPLRTEDDAKSALTTASPFYFMDGAGALNGISTAPTELSSCPERAVPASRGSVAEGPAVASVPATTSPFSQPMPEFDRALFPSFHGASGTGRHRSAYASASASVTERKRCQGCSDRALFAVLSRRRRPADRLRQGCEERICSRAHDCHVASRGGRRSKASPEPI